LGEFFLIFLNFFLKFKEHIPFKKIVSECFSRKHQHQDKPLGVSSETKSPAFIEACYKSPTKEDCGLVNLNTPFTFFSNYVP
jgi:hypothetical protein